VKIIAPPVFPTPLVAQRTERELKQLTKVTSDRIAKIIDVGRIATGDRMYVALELVSGTSLAEMVAANGPLELEVGLRSAWRSARARRAAKLGVIHRDVSPKNILVLDDERGVPRRSSSSTSASRPRSRQGARIPEFLSPEQAEGKPVDQRSNIYSLGALLYYMLSGAPPFTGDVDSVLRQQVHGVPEPLSKCVGDVPVPPELDRLVAKALDKPSSRRHLTLRQLLGELENVVAARVAPSGRRRQ